MACIFPLTSDRCLSWAVTYVEAITSLWSEAVSKACNRACVDRIVTESPANLLCLDPRLHKLWKLGRFGLKPLPATSSANEIRVELHWVHRGLLVPRDTVHYSDGETLESLYGRRDGIQSDDPWKWVKGNRIKTGQIFTIASENPKHLPSRVLLELQWMFSRLAAMSGATDAW